MAKLRLDTIRALAHQSKILPSSTHLSSSRLSYLRNHPLTWQPSRSIFGVSRLPLKLEEQRQSGEAKRIQTIGFRKPGPRLRNVAISLVAIYLSFHVYQRIILDPFAQSLEEIAKDLPLDKLEEGSKPLFIPFPGTTKELNVVPYRGSDPEWQEYVKFSKDQKLAQSVRTELATLVISVANRNPMLTLKAGKGMKLRRYWLDVDFPYSPPPGFERSGIEFGNDYVAWATQPVDSLTVFKTRRALWPSALTISMWSFMKVLLEDETNRFLQLLGLKSQPQRPPIEQILARHQQLIKGTKTPSKDGPPASPNLPTNAAKDPITVDTSKSMTRGHPIDPATNEPQTTDDHENVTQRLFEAVNSHFFRPMIAFKTKLAETWQPVQDYPPRGSILVSGFVEVDAPKAWIVVDVKAAWDPQTRKYDVGSMHLALRRMQAKKQGPQGGS